MKRKWKRTLSVVLSAAMLFGMTGMNTALAVEGTPPGTSGLCEHHRLHDDDCGYTEGTPETPCSHEHTDECYKEVTNCVHEHSGECYDDSGEIATGSQAREPVNCPHVCDEASGCITKALDCRHEHKVKGGLDRDSECGYTAAVTGTPCTYVCGECAKDKVNGDEADGEDGLGHSGNPPAGRSTEKECNCTSLCTADSTNTGCPVCGVENADLSLCKGDEIIVMPTLTGTVDLTPRDPRPGRSLTAILKLYTDPPGIKPGSFSYQWYRDDSEIHGETGGSYRVKISDVGHTIKLRVTASNCTPAGVFSDPVAVKMNAVTLPDQKVLHKTNDTGTHSLPLADLMPNDAMDVTYEAGEETDETGIISSWTVDGHGTVSYVLSGAGGIMQSATLPVTIVTKNYWDSTVNTVITLTDYDVITITVEPPAPKTYDGKAFVIDDFTKSATFNGEEVAGVWGVEGTPDLTSANTGLPVVVRFEPDAPEYGLQVTKTVKVTINKAKPTGTPGYTAITSADKTLADANLTVGDITPGGMIAWDLGPSQPVEANTAYAWTCTPVNQNYSVLTGQITPYDTITHRTITVQNDGNGTANADVNSAVAGTEITLTAVPASGYRFKEWQIIAGNVTIQNNKFKMPGENVVVKVLFEPVQAVNQNTITAAAGTGGFITPSGTVTVMEGKDQTFTIVAAVNYRIASVIVDGVNQGSIPEYTFTGVTKNHTITANFSYSSQGGGGSSSGGGGSSSGSGGGSSRPVGTTAADSKKGQVNSLTGIITGTGTGYSNWQPETAQDGSVSWKLQYADGTYAAGTMVTAADGTVYEQPAWELINGTWYPFGADGRAKGGFVYDPALDGIFYIDINTGMKTGWQLIDGKWYYFNPTSDGRKGIMFADAWIGEYYVDPEGVWVDGKIKE